MIILISQIKPGINQVNLESCCVMPKDLTEYAKQNDIQLLSHNDARGKGDKSSQNNTTRTVICTEITELEWSLFICIRIIL